MINQIEQTAINIRCWILIFLILISLFFCIFFLFTEQDNYNAHAECSTLSFWPPDMVPHGPHFPEPKQPKQPSEC